MARCGFPCRGAHIVSWLPAVVLFAAIILAGCAGRPGTSAGRVLVTEFDSQDYRLVWPLPISTTARITSFFGRRTDPITGMQRFHSGIDLDGETGNPIHASGAGKVVYSGERGSYGKLMIIDHGKGLTTYYGHCSRLLKANGAKVNRGEIIAMIGGTGRSTGSHLHFETRKHGRQFDPLLLLPKLKKL